MSDYKRNKRYTQIVCKTGVTLAVILKRNLRIYDLELPIMTSLHRNYALDGVS